MHYREFSLTDWLIRLGQRSFGIALPVPRAWWTSKPIQAQKFGYTAALCLSRVPGGALVPLLLFVV